MNINLLKGKNISLIISIIRDKKNIRRSDLYQEVIKLQRRKFGKSTTYQVISRDVSKLINRKVLKVIKGGQRSQILTLN